MKKMTVLLFVTLLTIGAKAQFYAQGGLNLANITNTNNGQTEKNHWLPTFNAGLISRLQGQFEYSITRSRMNPSFRQTSVYSTHP